MRKATSPTAARAAAEMSTPVRAAPLFFGTGARPGPGAGAVHSSTSTKFTLSSVPAFIGRPASSRLFSSSAAAPGADIRTRPACASL